jgi:hypothetical protein
VPTFSTASAFEPRQPAPSPPPTACLAARCHHFVSRVLQTRFDGDPAIIGRYGAPADPASIEFAESSLTVRLRWGPDNFRDALRNFLGPVGCASLVARIEREIQLPVSTVLINRQIELITMSGEPFVDFQMSRRDRCPTPHALLMGYTNGYYGYFPTILAASRGGYGALYK